MRLQKGESSGTEGDGTYGFYLTSRVLVGTCWLAKRACLFNVSFLVLEDFFFKTGCSQVRCAETKWVPGRVCHTGDSPGRSACLPDSTVCLHDGLAIYGGLYAIVDLCVCYIKYTEHSLVRSHYHIKATAGKLCYFYITYGMFIFS